MKTLVLIFSLCAASTAAAFQIGGQPEPVPAGPPVLGEIQLAERQRIEKANKGACEETVREIIKAKRASENKRGQACLVAFPEMKIHGLVRKSYISCRRQLETQPIQSVRKKMFADFEKAYVESAGKYCPAKPAFDTARFGEPSKPALAVPPAPEETASAGQ